MFLPSPAGRSGLLLLVLILIGFSCQFPRPEPSPRAPGATRLASKPDWIDLAGLQDCLAMEKGRVVVVNFWATWCEPCREEFPALIRLHERYADRGLTVLAISLDSSKVRDTLVKAFLDEHKPRFAVFIKAAGDDDEFINGVDPEWSGALPATFIYDRSGTRRHTLFGQQTLTTLENYLRPML